MTASNRAAPSRVISGGWPMILSALKSLLESSDPELVAA
jgi:hypothetical protein